MTAPAIANIGENYDTRYGFHDPEAQYVFKSGQGLTRRIIEEMSAMKGEPQWMLDLRLKALDLYNARPMPTWGNTGLLNAIDFDNIHYYVRPTERQEKNWDDVPVDIRNTFDKLGIPEAERKFLAGVTAQYESEVVYHSIRKDLEAQGVLFLGMDDGLKQYPDIVKEYFGTVIPLADNKFASLNSAVWSGGSFVYVPKGVHVGIPLQAYFRINTENMGQFERTLIIADEGSSVVYVEGCTAPTYSSDSLHSAVVELIAKQGAKIRYTTIQNWSKNVYNLVTKRGMAYRDATIEWVDGNLGCLTADTQLFTNPEGPISIAAVQPGQMVYAVDLNELQPRKYRVVATQCTGQRKTYRLTTENYREVKATDNHPFLTLVREPMSNRTQLEWRRLDSLCPGDLIGIVRGLPDEGKSRPLGDYEYPAIRGKPLKNIPRFPRETTVDLMWFLGLYLGDGGIEKQRDRVHRVYLAVPPNDRARKRLENVIPALFEVPWRPKHICVTVNSSAVADFILWLGFGGRAHEKRIPAWVFGLPAEQRLAFIEGYLDADGYVRKHKKVNGKECGQIVFASCNKPLLEDLRMLMISVGLNPLKISTYVKERKLYKGRMREYISHYLSLNIRGGLERIREKRVENGGIEFVRVKTIDPLGEEKVYDIEVEGAHNFIANGIVVHNSKLTMKYPAVYLMEPGAHAEILSVAFAGAQQHQDAGAKVIHAAPHTTSTIVSKSISKDGGRTSYRGLVKVAAGASGVKCNVRCDALLLDETSRSDTYPTMEIDEDDVQIGHEATVSKVGDEQLYYLRSRGISENDAIMMVINGFIEPFTKELPLEYAVELNRLIQLEMTGSVG